MSVFWGSNRKGNQREWFVGVLLGAENARRGKRRGAWSGGREGRAATSVKALVE